MNDLAWSDSASPWQPDAWQRGPADNFLGYDLSENPKAAWNLQQSQSAAAIDRAKNKFGNVGLPAQSGGELTLQGKVGALAMMSCDELRAAFIMCKDDLYHLFLAQLAAQCRHSIEFEKFAGGPLWDKFGADCGLPCAAEKCSVADVATAIGCPDAEHPEGLACVMKKLADAKGTGLLPCSSVDLPWPISKTSKSCNQLAQAKAIWQSASASESSPSQVVTLLGLSQFGSQFGDGEESAWWCLRKALAVAALRKCAWATSVFLAGDFGPITAWDLKNPPQPMPAVPFGFPICFWAAAEIAETDNAAYLALTSYFC